MTVIVFFIVDHWSPQFGKPCTKNVQSKDFPALDKACRVGQSCRMQAPPVLTPSAPKTKRKGRKKWIFLGVFLFAALAATIFFSLQKSTPTISVTTEKISRHTITETVVSNGRIYPVLSVHISAEVSGEITELDVKEGQFVHKGDLLLKIKPDFYVAALKQAQAGYESSLASKTTALANLEKAEAEFKRNQELFGQKLLSESDFIAFKVARDVAIASVQNASNQIEIARASVASAQDSLDKTTILAPLDGTVSKLNSQKGERVLGTVQNAGTDIMVISDMSAMEARVDIGEMDIVLLQPGQNVKLEVDSFKDKKFSGVVTDVANSSKDMNSSSSLSSYSSSSSAGQSATQFQVKIRFTENAEFRPGMSVSATIETRTRTNVIAAPIAAVTTRVVKSKMKAEAAITNSFSTSSALAMTNQTAGSGTNSVQVDKKFDANKPTEVVFVVEGDHVKTVPVKIGISDDNFWEITDGLKEGDEIVTGGFKAVMHDLDDGKKIKKGGATDFSFPKS
jgi:HlyD family secretion protein